MPKTWINTTSIHAAISGDDFETAKAKLLAADHADLVAMAINTRYNGFVGDLADFKDDERPQDLSFIYSHEGGKRIPYVGWYWRSTDFSSKRIAIGNCGDFIGVMENNKWDYPSRYLTESEADQVIAIIDAAMQADGAGGQLSQIMANTRREIEKLWPLFQTFTIERSAEDY